MDIRIEFPGGDRVDAVMNGLRLVTDQDGSAPSPFQFFLASIGTCAGIYVSSFLRQRGLPTEGLVIRQRMIPDPASRLIGKIELTIELPAGFPEQYREAVIRSAQLCAVKKHLERPPQIEVRTA
jgi:ribosomal protein S12 methylthiotransferase accessory factor